MSTSSTWSSSEAADFPAGGQASGGAPAVGAAASRQFGTTGRGQVTEVHPVRFGELSPEPAGEAAHNLHLLLDVVVEVSVELGRARLAVEQLMALGRGSVVQLDKLAGEPADVLVNGKPIARGEIVLLDEKLGVKITDIVTRARRLRDLP